MTTSWARTRARSNATGSTCTAWAPFAGLSFSGTDSAIDIALSDIKGQIHNAPIWELLGGKYRDRVRLHLLMGGASPDELRANAAAAAQEGFTAIKVDPIAGGYGDVTRDALVRGIVDRVAAARDTTSLTAMSITPIASVRGVDHVPAAHDQVEAHPSGRA